MSGVVSGLVPFEQAIAEVCEARNARIPLINAFTKAWYEAPYTWTSTSLFGVPVLKNPLDLWQYQHLIHAHQPKTILETGTAYGGSALWFALCLDQSVGEPEARVVTIDTQRLEPRARHSRIRYVEGSSTDPELLARLLVNCPRPLLVSLDSDHHETHVRRELELIAPYVQAGEWVVVEDTNVAYPEDRGPSGAVFGFLQAHVEDWAQDPWCERYLLTCHPGGWLRRIGGGRA